MTDEEAAKLAAQYLRSHAIYFGLDSDLRIGLSILLQSVAASARREALRDAELVVLAEHLEDPQDASDEAYDMAIDHAAAALRGMSEEGMA